MPAHRVLGKAFFQAVDADCVLKGIGGRDELVSRVLLIKALIPFMQPSPPMAYLPPKEPLSNNITFKVRVSTYEFWRDTDIQTTPWNEADHIR